MAEQQPEMSGRLHEIAQLLRGTHHLGPEAQQALANLADELGDLLNPTGTPPAEAAPILESTAQVVAALRHDQGTGVLAAARQRLEHALAEVEAHAPGSADFARRLLDVLANLGI
jgi:hypothetical protein